MQQLVYIQNKVDNSRYAARLTSGDEIIIIPSFTLPDNIVMNNLMYPADEMPKALHRLRVLLRQSATLTTIKASTSAQTKLKPLITFMQAL